MGLVICFLKMRARVREYYFLLEISYQLTNIDLPLNERVYEKYDTKSHCFIANLYYVYTKVQIVATF